MSDRLLKLYSLSNVQYEPGCPVIITAGNLLIDTLTDKAIIQLKLKSIAPKSVRAVTVSIKTAAANGNELECSHEYQYLDLTIMRDQSFGQKKAIYLKNATARSFTATVTEVVFADAEVWQSASVELVNLPVQEKARTYFPRSDLAEQYQIENGKHSEYIPTSAAGLWFCTCGAINYEHEDKCHACGLLYDKQTNNLSEEYLEKQSNLRHRAETYNKIEKKRRAQKYTLLSVIAILCIAIPLLLYNCIILPRVEERNNQNNYAAAMQYLEEEDFQKAIDAFDALGEYSDSAELKEFTVYYKDMLTSIAQKNWDDVKLQYSHIHGFQNADLYIQNANKDHLACVLDAVNGGANFDNLKTAVDTCSFFIETTDNLERDQALEALRKFENEFINMLQGVWICDESTNTSYELYEFEGVTWKREFFSSIPGYDVIERKDQGEVTFDSGTIMVDGCKIVNITETTFERTYVNSDRIKVFIKK